MTATITPDQVSADTLQTDPPPGVFEALFLLWLLVMVVGHLGGLW